MAHKYEQLGVSGGGETIFLDHSNTNVDYHIIETPNLLNLVREVLPTIYVANKAEVVVERDLGRTVGTTNLVETNDEDEIVYAKRIGRNKYSRFAKGRQPVPCSYIVVVLRKTSTGYGLWTAWCGRLLPKEAYQEGSIFNNTHAMAYDEKLVQLNTVTASIP